MGILLRIDFNKKVQEDLDEINGFAESVTVENKAVIDAGDEVIELSDMVLSHYRKRVYTNRDHELILARDTSELELSGSFNITDAGKELKEVLKLAKWSKVSSHEEGCYRRLSLEATDSDGAVYDQITMDNAFVVSFEQSLSVEKGNITFLMILRDYDNQVKYEVWDRPANPQGAEQTAAAPTQSVIVTGQWQVDIAWLENFFAQNNYTPSPGGRELAMYLYRQYVIAEQRDDRTSMDNCVKKLVEIMNWDNSDQIKQIAIHNRMLIKQPTPRLCWATVETLELAAQAGGYLFPVEKVQDVVKAFAQRVLYGVSNANLSFTEWSKNENNWDKDYGPVMKDVKQSNQISWDNLQSYLDKGAVYASYIDDTNPNKNTGHIVLVVGYAIVGSAKYIYTHNTESDVGLPGGGYTLSVTVQTYEDFVKEIPYTQMHLRYFALPDLDRVPHFVEARTAVYSGAYYM